MRMIRFGRTNLTVPAVSLGTWGHGGENKSASGESVGWSGHDDATAREALIAAWANGITHWDTADVYGSGHAESLIGSVWDDVPRNEIILATKVGWDAGEFGHYYHPEQIRRQMEASLENLRVDVIDIYYFHHCDFGPEDVYFADALDAMLRLREEGKFRFLGLSDWNLRKIMKFMSRVDPDVVQPYRNICDDDYAGSGLRAWIDQHDLGVAFFSPIKHGLLLGKYDHPRKFPEGDFRRNIPEFGNTESIARMKHAAATVAKRFTEHPQPVLHAVVGALLADAPTATVLLGQRNARQVEAAAAIGEPLTRDEAEWVRSVYRGTVEEGSG